MNFLLLLLRLRCIEMQNASIMTCYDKLTLTMRRNIEGYEGRVQRRSCKLNATLLQGQTKIETRVSLRHLYHLKRFCCLIYNCCKSFIMIVLKTVKATRQQHWKAASDLFDKLKYSTCQFFGLSYQ